MTWIALSLISISAIAIVIAVVLVNYHARTKESLPVTHRDRRVLLTAADCRSFMPHGFEVLADNESVEKSKYTDESVELSYKYRDPGSNLNINCTSTVYSSVSHAKSAYEIDHSTMLRTLDFRLRQTGWFEWGDESYLAILIERSVPVGMYFSGRVDDRTISFIVQGVVCEDAAQFDLLTSSILGALQVYDPKR